jgi:hypothetical protein
MHTTAHMPTSAALPLPVPSHHNHARADTRCDKPHPPQRHVCVMVRVTQNSAHLQPTHATSHTHTQHSNMNVLPASTTSRTAATTAHCAIITTRTLPRARYTQNDTQLRPPHTPSTENHTQSHTRPPRHTHDSRVRLPSHDGILPESWLLYSCNTLQDTRAAIASHHGTRRCRRPQRVARNASQRSAYHQSNQLN